MEQNSLPNVIAGLIVSLTLAAVGLSGAFLFMNHSYALPEGVKIVRGLVQQAREEAAKTGNGATLAFARDPSTNAYFGTIYDGRPNGGTFTGPTARVQLDRSISVTVDGAATSGMFISSSGSVTTDAWTDGTTYAAEPACPAGSFVVSIAADSKTQNFTVDCADARLP